MSLPDHRNPDEGRVLPRGSCHPRHSLVVLALVLRDVQLRVQLVEQRVRALLAQRVIHVRLPRHDVKEVAGDLPEELTVTPAQPPQQTGWCFFGSAQPQYLPRVTPGCQRASATAVLTAGGAGQPVLRVTLQSRGKTGAPLKNLRVCPLRGHLPSASG